VEGYEILERGKMSFLSSMVPVRLRVISPKLRVESAWGTCGKSFEFSTKETYLFSHVFVCM